MVNKEIFYSKMTRNNIFLLIFIAFVIFTIPCFGSDSKFQLSPEERSWISEHHIVRIRTGNSPPFMLTDGKIQGIAIDYLTYIFNINGIKIQYISEFDVTWPEALEYIKRHEVVDMVPTAKITDERKKDMIFTDEYIFAPWVIFTRTDSDFISSIDDLNGKTVSVEDGYVMHQRLKEDYPGIKLKVVPANLKDSAIIPVKDLSTGVVDAYIGNLLSTTYMIQNRGYTNVKVAAPTPFGNHNQAMAIRSDWPELVGIINKTLTSMTPEEHAAIRNKWLSIRYEYGINKVYVLKWVLSITGIAFFIIGVVLIWNKRLKTEVVLRKKTETALKYSEKKYKALFNNAQVALFRTGISDGQLLEINERYAKMAGYLTIEDCMAEFNSADAWADTSGRDKLVETLQENGFVLDYETKIIRKDKSLIWISFSATIFPEQGYIEGSIVDITERKKMEIALQESEEKYRHLIEKLDDIIWTVDLNLNTTYVSPSVEKNLGFTPEERLVQNPADQMTQSSYKNIAELLIKELNREQEPGINPDRRVRIEIEYYHKNGATLWFENIISGLRDKNGILCGFHGVARDISERNIVENEKIKTQKIIEEQKKLALVGQVAGKMAHDFNNILGIIMGNTELTLLDCQEPETRKTLELIFEQTIHGKNLTKNLVAFARDQEPKQEFFRISEKIDLVLNLMRKDLEGIELRKEESQGVPELLADPGMIEHALVNLIQNSIHALSMVEHPRITLRTYSLDNKICFEIEDNGCGISKENLGNIYGPSFTLKGSRDVTGSYKSGIKGTGYGMANVKKYVEQHKGSISIESEVGVGATFTICLPVIKKELTTKEKAELKKEITQFEKYILLVEDEAAISDVQYRILTSEPCNHKVDVAHNGQMAKDLFERNTYDFVSLDYVLPGGINGMDVYHHIRKTNQTVPVLFISGNIEFLESIKELKQKDAYIDHLSKPCQNKDYVNGINELLEKTLAEQQ